MRSATVWRSPARRALRSPPAPLRRRCQSPLWREILANVLGIPLTLPQTEQSTGYGGAMLAAVACGAYPSVQACADALVHAKKHDRA